MTLRDLIESGASAASLAAHLDGLDHAGRVAESHQLGRRHQRDLYDGASPTAPLTLADFADRPMVAIGHHGWNTFPGPSVVRRFVKRMVRQPDGRVGGYNDAPLGWLVGPGYFRLRQTVGDEQRHAPVVVDYHQLPTGPMPDGWPRRIPNWLGPQALIYGWCHDYLRRVSDHVTIGSAFKWGVPVGSWFVLVREP